MFKKISSIKFLSMNQIYEKLCLIRVYKFHLLGIDIYLNKKFTEAETNHTYYTRFVRIRD